MEGRFLLNSIKDLAIGNIYANKSALILDWLLREGVKRQEFSLREVARETGVSIGLAQHVFERLLWKGFLQVKGMRTSKRFLIEKPKLLFESWLDAYNIVKKCKMRTYRSGFQGKIQILDVLKKSSLSQKVVLALHSSAEAHGYKNTNLDTLELYMLDSSDRSKIEELLRLEPQERGYEVLLIEPYYESLLKRSKGSSKNEKICPLLLTLLDLYHFPLRGQEQAEFMAERIPELKQIYKSS